MNVIEKLREKLQMQKAEQQHQDNLRKNIRQTQIEIAEQEKHETKQLEEEVQKEKTELMKKNMFEGEAYFKCPRCSKEIPVANARDSRNPQTYTVAGLIEAQCKNKKCETKIKHISNIYLKHPIIYSEVEYGASIVKKIQHGYS